MIREPLLAPSLLSADPLDIRSSIAALEKEYDMLHVDVMDGCFVPNITFGPGFVKALRRNCPGDVLDVHLMVDQPEGLLDDFLDAGPDYLTVHVETDPHIHRTLSRIRAAGVKAGISLNPGTPEEMARPLLPFVDLVLVMSVNPGFGGQTFIETVMEKTRILCRWRAASHGAFLVEMDGGIGRDNAAATFLGGCDILVMGSSVFRSPEPGRELREIRKTLKEAIAGA